MALTYRGIPIRRIQQAWPQSRTSSAMYSIETTEPRISYTVSAGSIGTDGGVDEVIRTARLRAGQLLEEEECD